MRCWILITAPRLPGRDVEDFHQKNRRGVTRRGFLHPTPCLSSRRGIEGALVRSLRHKRQIREHVCLVSFAPRINDRCQVFEEARRAGTEREKKSERGGREENRVRRRVGFHPLSLSLSLPMRIFFAKRRICTSLVAAKAIKPEGGRNCGEKRIIVNCLS